MIRAATEVHGAPVAFSTLGRPDAKSLILLEFKEVQASSLERVGLNFDELLNATVVTIC